MIPADAAALALLAQACRTWDRDPCASAPAGVVYEGAPLPLDREGAHLARALEELRLVEVRGDRLVATHEARRRLDAVAVLLLDGLGSALRATREAA